MEAPDYFRTLLSVTCYPALFGVNDAMDLRAFLLGYGLGSQKPEMTDLLGRLTDFLKEEMPEWKESTCDWCHIVKANSGERGGSINLFRISLARMLLVQGHWTEEHFDIFNSKNPVSQAALSSLPRPN